MNKEQEKLNEEVGEVYEKMTALLLRITELEQKVKKLDEELHPPVNWHWG